MVTNHDPLSVTVEDGEVVVSVFNIDTYDSARVRLDPEEARTRGHEVLAAATDLAGGADAGTDAEDDGTSADTSRSQMGVPPGGPSTTPFRA